MSSKRKSAFSDNLKSTLNGRASVAISFSTTGNDIFDVNFDGTGSKVADLPLNIYSLILGQRAVTEAGLFTKVRLKALRCKYFSEITPNEAAADLTSATGPFAVLFNKDPGPILAGNTYLDLLQNGASVMRSSEYKAMTNVPVSFDSRWKYTVSSSATDADVRQTSFGTIIGGWPNPTTFVTGDRVGSLILDWELEFMGRAFTATSAVANPLPVVK